MSKGNTFENDLLNLIFNATAIANLADDASVSPAANLYWALHTADPGESGDQTTSEANYTSYARVAVARNSGGMSTSTAGSTSPVANVDFPAATGPTLPTVVTVTHFSIGMVSAGASKILYSGTVTPNINVSNGVQPRLTTASTITED